MTVMEHNPAELEAIQRTLRQRLKEFGRRVRGRLLLEAVAQWIAIVVGALLLTYVLDRTLRLSLITRRGLLLGLIVLMAVEAWRRLLFPLRLKLSPDLLAAALERKVHLPIAAKVATVLELPSQVEIAEEDTSAVMVDRAVRLSGRALEGVRFESHLDEQRKTMAIGTIVSILLLSGVLVLISPRSARLWAARLFAGSNEPWPQRTHLEIAGLVDGRMIVPRGEPFALRVSAKHGSVTPAAVSIRWQQSGGSRINGTLTKFGENDFRYDFPPVEADAELEVSGGDDRLGPVTIHPVDRPRLIDLSLRARHPADSEAKIFNFAGTDSGDLAFLPLTEMELRFTANTPIANVRVKSSTTQPAESSVHRLNERQFTLPWKHSAAVQTEIELISAEAGLVSVPTSVSIGLRHDTPPKVSLGFSGVRQRVTPQATIPLLAEARDDIGIHRIDLQTRTDLTDAADPAIIHSSATTQPVFGPATQPADVHTEVRQPQMISVEELKLEPGHLLTFTAAATDTCYQGAQTSTSRPIAFRVVKPEELFKEILLRQQSERAKYRKQIDESRKIRDGLGSTIDDSILSEMAASHRNVQREVARIQTALSDSLIEMRLNKLGTDEAHTLMERGILEPLKALDTELLRPQRDALELLRPGNAPALSQAAERQEQIVNRLEFILKQMSQWDSFIDVLNQLNEIIRVQNEVQQTTGKLKKDQVEGVFEP